MKQNNLSNILEELKNNLNNDSINDNLSIDHIISSKKHDGELFDDFNFNKNNQLNNNQLNNNYPYFNNKDLLAYVLTPKEQEKENSDFKDYNENIPVIFQRYNNYSWDYEEINTILKIREKIDYLEFDKLKDLDYQISPEKEKVVLINKKINKQIINTKAKLQKISIQTINNYLEK